MTGLEALLLLGGGALLYIGNQARSVANLNFFADDISAMTFEGVNPVAYLDLLVQNTSNVNISLNSLSGSVYVDNTLVGNVSNFTPVVSMGNSEAIMQVKVRLMALGLVNEMIQSFQYKNFSKKIDLRATVNANGVQLPITLTFQLG
jgi:hypothetical protein